MFNKVPSPEIALLTDYNQCKLQAHSAYMQGQEEQASALYHAAFEINKTLLLHYPIPQSRLTRSVHACLDCLDFCLSKNGKSVLYYLTETEALLASIIAGHHGESLRHDALQAYAAIIKAAISFRCELTCAGSKVMMRRLERVWQANSDLINKQ